MASSCPHYLRRCLFVTSCCDKTYSCRFCHNEAEDHELDRSKVEELVCAQCNIAQQVSTHCKECGIKFGMYSCLECRLFDDCDKKQFHCDRCGFCRTGGRENFFHCDNCEICLDKNVLSNHSCRSESGKDNCPVCFENVHTSTKIVFVPTCGHLIHFECLSMIMKFHYRNCPLCMEDYNNNTKSQSTNAS